MLGLARPLLLSYHMINMINSDCKSKRCTSDGFQQIGRQAKMANSIAPKTYNDPDLNMPHLVLKFHEKNCFSFSDTAGQQKKWTKNNSVSQQEFDGNQNSSLLLR